MSVSSGGGTKEVKVGAENCASVAVHARARSVQDSTDDLGLEGVSAVAENK